MISFKTKEHNMEKAIYSKKAINKIDTKDYYDCISDLLTEEEVLKLKNYSQHMATSRYQHCVNVSYYSYLFAKKFHCDEESCARAGLLHDLYYYDWKTDDERPMKGNHAKVHPIIALQNAEKITNLNYIERDAIVHHMWPFTPCPKTKEGWIVQGIDKYCALLEIFKQMSTDYSKASRLQLIFTSVLIIATKK